MSRRFDFLMVTGWSNALGPALAASLPAWIAEHEAAGDSDADRFLAELLSSGRIDGAAFRRALLVRGVPAVDAEQGTAPKGATVHGSFALLGEIGRGGQGTVFVARDLVLGRKVAFKVEAALPTAVMDQARFVREAQITAQLEHPNIVPVHELLRLHSGQRAYAMKVIEGRTLAELTRAAKARHEAPGGVDEPRELTERLDFFLRVCDAVGYAHSRGVVHRDLKLQNVMIGPHREVYVMDWGVARLLEGGGNDAPSKALAEGSPAETPSSNAIGTPKYMSPEQARGEVVGPASDQYSLGLMLQELVTLRPAPVAAPIPDLALFHATQAARAPMVHFASGVRVSRELVAIVDRSTARNAADRYPTVDALAADVRAFLRGDELRALPDDFVRRWTRGLVRHRELLVRAVLVSAIVVVVAFSATFIGALGQVNRAQVWELQSRAALTDAERSADAIELLLSHYGQVAEAVAAAVTILLAHGTPRDDDGAFPELRLAPVYGEPVTFAAASLLRPPSAPSTWAPPGLAHLGALEEDLRRALIRSGTDGDVYLNDDASWALLAERGVPVRRVNVVLDDGTYLSYPGTAATIEPKDHHLEAWYEAAAEKRFLHWRVQKSGSDVSIVTVSRSIFASEGADFNGVVSLEVWLPATLVASSLFASAWLLGPDGDVIVASGGRSLDPRLPGEISYESPWVGMDAGERRCASAPLRQVGWVYVGCAD